MREYKIKITLASNGERLPMIIDTSTGSPDYWSTLYVIAHLRAKGLASKTIELTLQNILIFKTILEKRDIDEDELATRFKKGYVLTQHEIEGLTEELKFHAKDIPSKDSNRWIKKFALNSLESFRGKSNTTTLKTVDPKTAATRMRNVRDYITWLSNSYLGLIDMDNPVFSKLKESKEFIIEALNSRLPRSTRDSDISQREGLSKEHIDLLLKTTDRNSEINPWKSEFTKTRNELIVVWLFQFGLRAGELLSLKVSNVNFQKEEFTILRRADDPDDPRRDQPNVKTLGRKIPMPKKIVDLTLNYILNFRKKLPHAKSHEFLFVADKTGMPMSRITLSKVFEQIKESNKELPRDLSPHILRHCWNDNFSEMMDGSEVLEEREKQMRSYLMGWSQTSNTSATYTRRHVRKKANEVILKMNEKINIEDPRFNEKFGGLNTLI